MSDTKRPLRAFLCHASDDKPAVRDLYKLLVSDGVDAWLDEEKLIPGQKWEFEIPRAVRDSDIVIVCLSSHSITKEGFVQKEIKFALDIADEKPDETIFIIPARLESCVVPEQLRKYQRVDLFSENGYMRLLKALQARSLSIGTDFSPNIDKFEKSETYYYHIRTQRMVTIKKTADEPKFSFNLSADAFTRIETNLRNGETIHVTGESISGFEINNGFVNLSLLRSRDRAKTSQLSGTDSMAKEKFWDKLKHSDDIDDITAELIITDIYAKRA